MSDGIAGNFNNSARRSSNSTHRGQQVTLATGKSFVRVEPIYTADTCRFAFQLCWSLTIFWKVHPPSDGWLQDLRLATKVDGVRILRHRFGRNDCSLFLVSTRPDVHPSSIAWSIKGRLQRLLRERVPNAFQRNYDLHSIGSTHRDKVEGYVARQLKQHPPLNDRQRADFADLQFENLEVDLSRPRFSAHGRYFCNLHLVFVHAERWCENQNGIWLTVRDMIRKASSLKGHLLSRVGIVPDHLHLTLGMRPEEMPQEVALSYMNNIAYVYGMKPIFMHGCFIGGFGKYDLGAIRD